MACPSCAPQQLDGIAQVDHLLNLSVKRIRWGGHHGERCGRHHGERCGRYHSERCGRQQRIDIGRLL